MSESRSGCLDHCVGAAHSMLCPNVNPNPFVEDEPDRGLWPDGWGQQEPDDGVTTSTKLQIKHEPRSFGPCPKCECEEVDVRFHKGGRAQWYPYRVESCRYTEEGCGTARNQAPHLLVTCSRCHYAWKERPSTGRSKP